MINRKLTALAAALLLSSFALPAISHAEEDCGAKVKLLQAKAEKVKDAKVKSKVEKLLKEAEDELVTEHDAKECLEYAEKAEKLLK